MDGVNSMQKPKNYTTPTLHYLRQKYNQSYLFDYICRTKWLLGIILQNHSYKCRFTENLHISPL